MVNKKELNTTQTNTWCPGCPNHMILESVKQAIVGSGFKQNDFCMATDIGCNSKIFDYLNISGFYGLHGRAIPTGWGIKMGNPNLKVLSFLGDGAAYAEGISHLIHAIRYDFDMSIIVHDNQSFSLTTGQCTPTSQQGFKSKAEPLGEQFKPLNPIKLALASNATFIARTNARDIKHMTAVLIKAIKHKGTSFVEIIQDCLIFNLDMNAKDKIMYKIKDNKNLAVANKLADEWDYNSKKGKIPMGILYHIDK